MNQGSFIIKEKKGGIALKASTTSVTPAETQLAQTRKYGLWHYIKRDRWLFFMIAPGVIGFFIFLYIPLYGVIITFQRYNIVLGFLKSKWVGFHNFREFFTDPYFFRLLRNTFLLSFYSLLFGFPFPIVFSLLLNEVRFTRFQRFTQAISYLPHFISTVVIVGILFSLISYEGLINNFFASLGFERILFRTEPKYFRFLYVTSGIWQEMGWGSIVYLAAIAGVDAQLYDAATIDGCGRFGRLWHVTLPGIAPTVVLLFILRVGRLLTIGFEKVYLMYNPSTYVAADVFATYVFRRGIQGGEFSFATTVGLFNSLISLVLIVIANAMARRFSDYSLW